jgi:hypothetical protein
MASTADLGNLKIGDFAPHIGSVFEMQSPPGVVSLKLAKAAANGLAVPAGVKGPNGEEIKAREGGGFTLQFVAPESSRLKQGNYQIEHPKLGTLEIFLVPTGPLAGGFGYHAVFG